MRDRSLALSLRPLVGTRFQVLFHSPSGVLFTFPSRYWFTIGHERVFSLRRWSSRIPTRFLVSRGTWDLKSKPISFRLQGFHLLWRYFPEPSARRVLVNFLAYAVLRPTTPREPKPSRFGLFRVRSPLLTESRLLSFPPGTEMVHFPGFASPRLCIQRGIFRYDPEGVAPFGNPGINACLRLPRAYRSLPRPSSPLCAKASTVHP